MYVLDYINISIYIVKARSGFLQVEKMKKNDRSCSLTLDEMSIEAKMEYDLSSQRVLGAVTLPNHTGLATHGLVFMLSGICSRWKQTVAYYYTGQSAIIHIFDAGNSETNIL